jgi:hypothetical protein
MTGFWLLPRRLSGYGSPCHHPRRLNRSATRLPCMSIISKARCCELTQIAEAGLAPLNTMDAAEHLRWVVALRVH